MINNKLCQEVLDFDLDHPMSEYGFSTRLAAEQYWTKEFTASAILEYKKFMYLAAVSDQMVSPSEIVDVVWHQHLIFTTSYHEFCNLLGKQIQHIPSTHNREEVDKFKAAHERTHKIYRESFGDPPVEIWEYFGMFDTLGLTKSTHKLRSVVDMGIMFFFLAIPIFYFLLRGLYVKINNPYFLNGYVPFALIVIGGLHLFNKNKLLGIIRSFHPRSFIFRLRPAELIFLKTHDMERVVHGIMGEFAKNDEIRTTSDNYIEWAGKRAPRSLEEFLIVDELQRT